jgi:DNA-binding MarR family transcriptional regulator
MRCHDNPRDCYQHLIAITYSNKLARCKSFVEKCRIAACVSITNPQQEPSLPIDPLKDHLGYALRRASATAMADLASKLATLELRPTEATVLLIIDANDNITQSDIGRMLDIASANMAPLTSRLEQRDLIEREPMDGRSHGLTLSSTGRALTRRIKKLVDEHEASLLQRIPTKQRDTFLAALQSLWSGDET